MVIKKLTKMEQYRIQEIAKSYPNFNPEIVAYGSQILYEMEMDLKAMKQAILYLNEYIDYRKGIKDTYTFGDNFCNQALELLVKRVSKYSCPNNKKDKYKTDGDVWSKCLLLHFDETIILKMSGVKDLKQLIKQLKKIEKEVVENYGLS